MHRIPLWLVRLNKFTKVNAGSSWISDFNGGANISLYKILFTENHAGLISGSQGKILKNTDYIVPVELTSFTPVEYLLEQNFPNPFNPSTTISFVLPEAAEVTLKIYNTLGQKVAELVNTTLESGRYSYVWRAENFPNGTYIYELRANDFKLFKKMILLK